MNHKESTMPNDTEHVNLTTKSLCCLSCLLSNLGSSDNSILPEPKGDQVSKQQEHCLPHPAAGCGPEKERSSWSGTPATESLINTEQQVPTAVGQLPLILEQYWVLRSLLLLFPIFTPAQQVW